MKQEVEESLKTFVTLLPEYLPEKLGNPYDLNRWLELCYNACKFDSKVELEDLCNVLKEKFGSFGDEEILKSARNYMDDYNSYMFVLSFLKQNNYLK